MIDAGDIKDAVTPDEYLTDCGHELKFNGRDWRGPCPICGGSDGATKFVVTDVLWHCKGCGEGGDIISLYEKLNSCTFSQAIKALGTKYGVCDSTAHEQAEKHKTRKKKSAAKRKKQLDEMDENACTARALWDKLSAPEGQSFAYLSSRGVHNLEGVRATERSVVLPLYDFTGVVINCVGRFLQPGTGPKVMGVEGCSTLGTFGNFREQVKGKPRVQFVLVEGFFDYLSAVELFGGPDTCVIGAHGCVNMPSICAMVAHKIGTGGIRLFPHNDAEGMAAAQKARQALKDNGVPPERVITHTIPQPHNDLNDFLINKTGEFGQIAGY